jgi:hypothetical protein
VSRLHPRRGVSAAWLARVGSGGFVCPASRPGWAERRKAAIPAPEVRSHQRRIGTSFLRGFAAIPPPNTACGRSGPQARRFRHTFSRLPTSPSGQATRASRTTLRLQRDGRFRHGQMRVTRDPSPLAGEGGPAKQGRMRGATRRRRSGVHRTSTSRETPHPSALRAATFSRKGRRDGASASAPPDERARVVIGGASRLASIPTLWHKPRP